MSTTTRPAELHSGVWTSWLPLTSAWPSQSACNSAAWVRDGIQTANDYWPYIYDPAYGQYVANSPTCLPPQATQWWDGDVTSTGIITRFSLGPVVCPAPYSTVDTIVVSGTSTSVRCCPTNYDFVQGLEANGGFDGVCTSAMTSGQSLVYASPTGNSFASATTTYTASALLLAVPVEGYNFAAVATSTSSSARSTVTSNSQTGGSAATSTLETITSVSSSARPTSTNKQSSGLTTGAKAGIGVGIALVAIIIIAASVIFWQRRKRVGSAASGNGAAELPGTETKPGALVYTGRRDGYQGSVAEIAGTERPTELP